MLNGILGMGVLGFCGYVDGGFELDIMSILKGLELNIDLCWFVVVSCLSCFNKSCI